MGALRLPWSVTQPVKRPRAGRPAWKCAEEYGRFLRRCACIACGASPRNKNNPIVAAHVDHAGGKGQGTKVADRHMIPLCNRCHDVQHRIGWPAFERRLPGGSAVAVAATFWDRWPGSREWEADLAAQEAAGVPMRGRP